ncbi:creatininase family protein [Pistricoccus aurantiacus]|uniref:Creatininase family protein n=1 Tax=Pistricoccus aurantiacus TaxID=1883414 RepID=A0A5B8SRV2_9GAMM|nr:creatininase family protein [Pistricoccus aurantiacus]QEA39366.1 creatininase family protein [Pistricoccus aurantiacus]
MSIVLWQSLTSADLAAALRPDSVAVMVLGAVEQHGKHLPLSTDLDIGQGLLNAALERLEPERSVLVLPPLAVGASEEHDDFPGTLSLPAATAQAVIEALGDSVARSGIRRLVLINSHGGNQSILAQAALALRRRHGMLVVKAFYMRMSPPEDSIPREECHHGLHGGAMETAMMLHLAPERVRREHIAHSSSIGEARAAEGQLIGPEGEAAFAWLAQDLHPDGVAGNATLASTALGERLVTHFGERLARVIREASEMDISRFHPDC